MDILMASSSISVPRGTRDLAGEEAAAFVRLEEVSRKVFQLHKYSEVRTPVFESSELFKRSLGETSDVVEKEMFSFLDRGEREFSLRPEGTAGVVRYFLENKLYLKGSYHRLFYSGPMFRAERPQAGRYRQFWQIGAEYFGDPEATADADTVFIVSRILSEFGIGDFTVQINSLGCNNCRPKYKEALLQYLKGKEKLLSEESLKRMKLNPLRVLDSKEDGPKLQDAPQMKQFLCADCADKFRRFTGLLENSGFKFEENPKLVRGLDYYTGTVFEIVSPVLGAQNAVAAGGRYDNLVEFLGGPPTPAVGFALGMDRVVEAHFLNREKTGVEKSLIDTCCVIPMTEEAVKLAFDLAQMLRHKGLAVPPVQSYKKKLKNQLSSAAEIGAKWAILIGEDEIKAKYYSVKNLVTREQSQVAQGQIFDFVMPTQ